MSRSADVWRFRNCSPGAQAGQQLTNAQLIESWATDPEDVFRQVSLQAAWARSADMSPEFQALPETRHQDRWRLRLFGSPSGNRSLVECETAIGRVFTGQQRRPRHRVQRSKDDGCRQPVGAVDRCRRHFHRASKPDRERCPSSREPGRPASGVRLVLVPRSAGPRHTAQQDRLEHRRGHHRD